MGFRTNTGLRTGGICSVGDADAAGNDHADGEHGQRAICRARHHGPRRRPGRCADLNSQKKQISVAGGIPAWPARSWPAWSVLNTIKP